METVNQFMTQAVHEGVFPAAELLVARQGDIVHHGHFGAATPGMRFDIASLTKPVATATRCMQLVSTGALHLDRAASGYLPILRDTKLARVTCRQLLSHMAGCAAWRPFYRNIPAREVGTPEGHIAILQQIIAEPLEAAPGARCVYSDLGYMLLGAILEHVDGRGLEVQFQEEIARPLELADTGFRPLPQSRRPGHTTGESTDTGVSPACAPTEDCPWRDTVLQGAVHDQNAFAMGGVAGHAGLFSTAEDLHTFVYQMITCWRGHSEWIRPEIVRDFLDFTHLGLLEDASHLCGWDTPRFTNSQAGHHFSAQSIGHLGYTGCSVWVDLQKQWWVVLLTNRVHPTPTNEKIRSFRPQLHDAIYECLFRR